MLVGQQDPLRADARAFASALREPAIGHASSSFRRPATQSLISPRAEEGGVTVREIVATAARPG